MISHPDAWRSVAKDDFAAQKGGPSASLKISRLADGILCSRLSLLDPLLSSVKGGAARQRESFAPLNGNHGRGLISCAAPHC
mmetsp:Transcript_39245/g.155684  ORF Transcript_39245/g.155684 Transcript_39245/m.155684 type:complete len:82 (-) Transcript_39245:41-286(-)